MDDLITLLKSYRCQNNLSIRDIAALLGVSPATISRLERGIGEPDQTTEKKIASFLSGDDPKQVIRWEYTAAINNRFSALEDRVKRMEALLMRKLKEGR